MLDLPAFKDRHGPKVTDRLKPVVLIIEMLIFQSW